MLDPLLLVYDLVMQIQGYSDHIFGNEDNKQYLIIRHDARMVIINEGMDPVCNVIPHQKQH